MSLLKKQIVKIGLIIMILFISLISCDRNSSPEGRMQLKMEELQKSMIDSLKQQNKAILDSLSNIRKELKEIKLQKKD
ncbi:MAG TPA: hypothetical protein VN192_04490 [Flavobacterium sp.]|jgi:hypothetical protein|nr:hypothetical protein [Flavobacterium sp.]